MIELAKMVIKAFGIKVNPVFKEEREGDIRRSCADMQNRVVKL